MKETLIFVALVVISSSITGHAALTGTYIIGPDANNQAIDNGNGTYTMTSTPTTYSWVDFSLNQPVTFSQLTDVNAVFNDIAGGAGGGAPRLTVYFSNGGDINILLGSSPDFNDGVAGLNGYSGVNVIGNNDVGRYDTSNDGLAGGNPFTTYSAALLAQAGLANLQVTDIQMSLDGAWAANTGGFQELTLSSINAAVPEPTTLIAGALLLLPFGASMLRIIRKRQTA